MHFRCSSCGDEHDLSALTLGAAVPDPWLAASEAERARSVLTADQCVIQGAGETNYYLRGCLQVPVRGAAVPFEWGVWVSLSERSHEEVVASWDDSTRVERGPYFGWLCTSLAGYPDTLLLKTHVHQRAPGLRPLIELEPTEHPLAVHQREGIEPEALWALVQPQPHQ